MGSYGEDLDILSSLTGVSSEEGESVFGCYTKFGFCLS